MDEAIKLGKTIEAAIEDCTQTDQLCEIPMGPFVSTEALQFMLSATSVYDYHTLQYSLLCGVVRTAHFLNNEAVLDACAKKMFTLVLEQPETFAVKNQQKRSLQHLEFPFLDGFVEQVIANANSHEHVAQLGRMQIFHDAIVAFGKQATCPKKWMRDLYLPVCYHLALQMPQWQKAFCHVIVDVNMPNSSPLDLLSHFRKVTIQYHTGKNWDLEGVRELHLLTTFTSIQLPHQSLSELVMMNDKNESFTRHTYPHLRKLHIEQVSNASLLANLPTMCPNLTELHLSSITPVTVTQTPELDVTSWKDSLIHLDVYTGNIQGISECRNLQSLSLWNIPTNYTLFPIIPMRVEKLALFGCTLDFDFSHWDGYTFREVELCVCTIPDENLSCLEKLLLGVKTVSLEMLPIKDISFLRLSKNVSLTNIPRLFDLSPLKKSVEYVVLDNCSLVTDISPLSKAHSVHITACYGIQDFSPLLDVLDLHLELLETDAINIDPQRCSVDTFRVEMLTMATEISLLNASEAIVDFCPAVTNLTDLHGTHSLVIKDCVQCSYLSDASHIKELSLQGLISPSFPLHTFTGLQELILAKIDTYVVDLTPLCDRIKLLQVTSSSIYAGDIFSKLQTLILREVANLSDLTLFFMATKVVVADMPNLENATLPFATRAFFTCCPQLQSVFAPSAKEKSFVDCEKLVGINNVVVPDLMLIGGRGHAEHAM